MPRSITLRSSKGKLAFQPTVNLPLGSCGFSTSCSFDHGYYWKGYACRCEGETSEKYVQNSVLGTKREHTRFGYDEINQDSVSIRVCRLEDKETSSYMAGKGECTCEERKATVSAMAITNGRIVRILEGYIKGEHRYNVVELYLRSVFVDGRPASREEGIGNFLMHSCLCCLLLFISG